MANPSANASRWMLPVMLGLLALLVFLSTLLAPATSNREALANRSAYNSQPSGTRAWYLSAQKVGVPVRLWHKSFAEMATIQEPVTMMVVFPYTYSAASTLFSPKEAGQLLEWVARGNTLILLDDFRRDGAGRMAYTAGLQLRVSHQERENQPKKEDPEAAPQLKALPLNNLQGSLGHFISQPILSRSNVAFQIKALPPTPEIRPTDQPTPLLADPNGNPKLVRLPYGHGALILGTAWDLADNAFLLGPANDNYQFLVNLLRQEGKPVYVNEYVHGYGETEDLMTYFGHKTPLGPIFAQLVLGFVLLLWLSLRPWTPKPSETRVAEMKDVSTTGVAAYIQSMAQWYARTHAASLVLAPQVRRIETLLRQRFRLTLEDTAGLKHLLGPLPGDYDSHQAESPETLLAALLKARTVIQNQERLPDRELLRLAQHLTLIEEKLHHERKRTHLISR